MADSPSSGFVSTKQARIAKIARQIRGAPIRSLSPSWTGRARTWSGCGKRSGVRGNAPQ